MQTHSFLSAVNEEIGYGLVNYTLEEINSSGSDTQYYKEYEGLDTYGEEEGITLLPLNYCCKDWSGPSPKQKLLRWLSSLAEWNHWLDDCYSHHTKSLKFLDILLPPHPPRVALMIPALGTHLFIARQSHQSRRDAKESACLLALHELAQIVIVQRASSNYSYLVQHCTSRVITTEEIPELTSGKRRINVIGATASASVALSSDEELVQTIGSGAEEEATHAAAEAKQEGSIEGQGRDVKRVEPEASDQKEAPGFQQSNKRHKVETKRDKIVTRSANKMENVGKDEADSKALSDQDSVG
jgi:hypothetical protein